MHQPASSSATPLPLTETTYAPQNRRTQMVAQQITQLITSGTLAPGARLPNETDLCGHFNVSRTTLREAIQTLRARGLLDVSPGRGSYVRKPDLKERLNDLALALNMHMAPTPTTVAMLIHGLLIQALPGALQAPLKARQKLFQHVMMADCQPTMNLELEQGWQRALVQLSYAQVEDSRLANTLLALLHQLQTPARLPEMQDRLEISRCSQGQLRATTALVEDDATSLQHALQEWLLRGATAMPARLVA